MTGNQLAEQKPPELADGEVSHLGEGSGDPSDEEGDTSPATVGGMCREIW